MYYVARIHVNAVGYYNGEDVQMPMFRGVKHGSFLHQCVRVQERMKNKTCISAFVCRMQKRMKNKTCLTPDAGKNEK